MKYLNTTKKKGSLLFLSVFALIQVSFAQHQLNQVYTKYGIGNINKTGPVRNQSMGGTGLATPGLFSINTVNPALLIYNPVTSLELNIANDYRKSTNLQGELYRDNEISFGAFRFAFPVYKGKWQTSLGITPYSNINYELTEVNAIGTEALYAYEKVNGQGGINQVSWKNGFRVAKKLYLGADASYYFGESSHEVISYLKENATDSLGNLYAAGSVAPLTLDRKKYKGLNTTLGFSFLHEFDSSRIDLFLGGTYDLSSNLNVTSTKILAKPGLFDTTSVDSRISIPGGLGIGVGISIKDSMDRKKWLLEFNYLSKNYQPNATASLNQTTMAFGVEKFPSYKANSLIGRSFYRFGAYRDQNAILYKNEGIDELGITFGVGMLMRGTSYDRRVRSIFDVGVTLGSHGKISSGLIRESFFRLNLSLTFNDKWFQKIRLN